MTKSIKSLAALAIAVLTSASQISFAYARDDDWRDDRGHHGRDWGRGHGRGYDHDRATVIVTSPPVIRRDVYVDDGYYYVPRNRPRPVYVPQPVYVAPPEYAYAQPSEITCTNNYNPLPTIVGGVAGGAIGTQIGKGSGRTAAIIGGALLGGALGSRYTYADQVCTRRVFETAQVGTPLYWRNPETNYSYTVTPTHDYQTDGRYCREYRAVADVSGRQQQTYGTACMQPDGSWQIVN